MTLGLVFVLTNQCQPDRLQFSDGYDCQSHPQRRLAVECQPKESLVRCTNQSSARLIGLRCTLEDPVGVACLTIYFIPPAKTDQAPSSYILQVIEVGCEEQDSDDEDEDEVFGKQEAAE